MENSILSVIYDHMQQDISSAESASKLKCSVRKIQIYRKYIRDTQWKPDENSQATQINKDVKVGLSSIQRNKDRVEYILNDMYELMKNSIADRPPIINNESKLPFEYEFQSENALIIQLSDLHSNSIVNVTGNCFDTEVLSKRLQKHFHKSIEIGKRFNVNRVIIALTGDQSTMTHRISQITEMASNRVEGILNLYFMIVEGIQDVLRHVDEVYIASICGNESRIYDFMNNTKNLDIESFDFILFKFLQIHFTNDKRVHFLESNEVHEQVLSINGKNIIMVHGDRHNFIASKTAEGFERLKVSYSKKGISLDFLICGHIHQTLITDTFARSGSIKGDDTYSKVGLNLSGTSSQNCLIIQSDGAIVPIANNLQDYSGFDGYSYPITEGLRVAGEVKNVQIFKV
jgi:hypothetical protein